MDIKQIREQYPQYNDLSDQQLADNLHKRYYADLPKNEFYSKIGLNTDYNERLKGMTPQDISIARSKNDEFGDYLRSQVPDRMEGETEQQAFQRKYGGISQPEVGTAEGAARAFQQGLTFGYGDELQAATGAVLAGYPYEQYRDIQRSRLGQFREESPVIAYGSEIAGAIPTSMAPVLNVARGGNYARAIGTGALQGGLYGTGSGDGDIKDRAVSGAVGAGVGGLVGAASVPIAKGVSNLAERLATSRANKDLGVSPTAYNILQRTMQADDSLTGAGAERIRQAGPQGMIADAGPSASGLLDTAIQSGGGAARIGREAIDARTSEATRAVNEALNNSLGEVGVSSSRAIRVFGDKTNPLTQIYKNAYSKPIDYSSTQGMFIENAIRNRVPASVVQTANRLMQLEGAPASQQIAAKIDDAGNVLYETLPDVRQVDYITRALNQMAQSGEGQGALGGQTQIGRAYQTLAKDIRGSLKEIVPEYKNALNMAADAISEKQAKDLGLQMLSSRLTRDDVRQAVTGMSGAEKRRVAEGLRQNIDDVIARTKTIATDSDIEARETFNLLKNLSSRESRDKVSLLLGKEQSGKLFNELDQARKAFELKANVATGSKTFARQEFNRMVQDEAEGGFLSALREGEAIKSAKELVKTALGRSADKKQAISDAQYEEMARILTGLRGDKAINFLNNLAQYGTVISGKGKMAGDITSALMTPAAPIAAATVANPMTNALMGR